jgi:formate hydrogenlyase transcriptional activator
MNGLLPSSSEAMPYVSKLILAGAPLPDVLTIIARLAESRGDGAHCSIWLPERSGKRVYCAAAPSLPSFREHVGPINIGRDGGPVGAAIHQQSPIYLADIVNDADWRGQRNLLAPFEVRALWARPFLCRDGQLRGALTIHYREPHSPSPSDLELMENISNIVCIAIERHASEGKLRLERDRLRLLLEITNSMASKLDLRQLVETLSTDLLRVVQCDFCALLLPNSDQSAFELTTLYNRNGEASCAME